MHRPDAEAGGPPPFQKKSATFKKVVVLWDGSPNSGSFLSNTPQFPASYPARPPVSIDT